jgi:hypothetical protein
MTIILLIISILFAGITYAAEKCPAAWTIGPPANPCPIAGWSCGIFGATLPPPGSEMKFINVRIATLWVNCQYSGPNNSGAGLQKYGSFNPVPPPGFDNWQRNADVLMCSTNADACIFSQAIK